MTLHCVFAGISTELCRPQVTQVTLGCNREAQLPYCERDLYHGVIALLSPGVLVAVKAPITTTLAASSRFYTMERDTLQQML